MGAAFLATTSTAAKAGTGGGVSEGGKSQRGVNHLSLEEVPSQNIKICVPEDFQMMDARGDFHFMPDSVSVVIPPFETSTVKMTFVVSRMVSYDEDRVLILNYSQQKTPSPQILTPLSIKAFFDKQANFMGVFFKAIQLESDTSANADETLYAGEINNVEKHHVVFGGGDSTATKDDI